MAKQIELTKGLFATVDDHNFEWLSQWKWQASGRFPFIYASRKIRLKSGKRKDILMHRVIARTPDGMLCDHINHDTLCNLEENLRNVTSAQNGWNRRGGCATTGEKNIYMTKHGTFMVTIHKDRSLIFNKTFKTLEIAVTARNEVLKEHFGEYAFNYLEG